MSRAIATFTAASLLCAGCAPPNAPPREPPAHLLLAEAAPAPPPPPPAPPPPPPSSDQASAPPAPADASNSGANEEHHAGSAMPRAIGWYAIGLGAASGLVAIGTSIMMLHQQSIRNADCDAQKVCSADGIGAAQQLDRLAGWNVGAYVVAAVGLGVGTILVLTHPKSGTSEAINVTPTGLELRGTF